MKVAVTAYCACNCLGRTTSEVIDSLVAGQRGLDTCPLDVPFEMPCGTVAGPLPELPAEHSDVATRQHKIGWLAFQEIAGPVAQAIERWGAHRVGAVLGTSTGGIEMTERAYFQWRSSGEFPSGYTLRCHAFHSLARVLRGVAGWRGPTSVVSTACSSSAKVFSSARRLLRSGRCDAVLVGGIDSLALTTVRGFHSLSAASEQPCRPFSADRTGMNVGEGAAYLLLEREGPERDSAAVAYLTGIGESNDAFHMSAPDPQGRGAAAAMTAALTDASIKAEQVNYVNAHGTGTLRNDVAESRAIATVLGCSVPVVSTKSYTGHMLGASGATEAVFAVASLEHQWIPANLDVLPADPEIEINLPRHGQSSPVAHVVSNSFAFGGNNISLVLSRATS